MEKLKLITSGHSGHGKDEFCKILAEKTGYFYEGSSYVACMLFLFDELKDKYGYATVNDCYNDRHNHQEEFFTKIVEYNTPDLTRLGGKIFGMTDVYNGIRNINEFVALQKAKLFDLSIWVDASKRKPFEAASSITITDDVVDIILDNNGDLDDLNVTIDTLIWFLPLAKGIILSHGSKKKVQFKISRYCVTETVSTSITRYRNCE